MPFIFQVRHLSFMACQFATFQHHRILLELNPKEDPVWLYLDSQYRYIMSKMKTVYQKRLKQLEGRLFSCLFRERQCRPRLNTFS